MSCKRVFDRTHVIADQPGHLRCAAARDLPILLVGAFARDLLFWHMHGIEPGRATADIVYPMNALAEDQLGRLRELLAGTGVPLGM